MYTYDIITRLALSMHTSTSRHQRLKAQAHQVKQIFNSLRQLQRQASFLSQQMQVSTLWAACCEPVLGAPLGHHCASYAEGNTCPENVECTAAILIRFLLRWHSLLGCTLLYIPPVPRRDLSSRQCMFLHSVPWPYSSLIWLCSPSFIWPFHPFSSHHSHSHLFRIISQHV